MKRTFITFLAMALIATASAIDIKTVRTAGPFRVVQPMVVDSVDAGQRKINTGSLMTLLGNPLSLNVLKNGQIQNLDAIAALPEAPTATNGAEIQLMQFSFIVSKPTEVEVKVKGPKYYSVYLNKEQAQGKQTLLTGKYDAVLKYIADTAAVSISLEAGKEEAITVVDLGNGSDARRPFTMDDNMQMKHYSGFSISPSGKYAIITAMHLNSEGRTQYKRQLVEVATGKVLHDVFNSVSWMPRSDRFVFTRRVDGNSQLVSADPVTLKEEILAGYISSERFIVSPTEDFAILIKDVSGPEKEKDVYQVITLDDRQPGWRSRSTLSKIDFKSGLIQPLTYGHHSLWPCGISENGVHLYLTKNDERLEKRPTTVTSMYRLNLETMTVDTLFEREDFVESAQLIKRTNKIAIIGSPEAFNGIGKNLPADMTPSIYDHQLFIFDADTKKVDAVTRDFDPSVNDIASNGKDGYLYFTADNADSVSLYRMDLRTYAIKMVPQPCDVLQGISIAANTNAMLVCGNSPCIPDRIYSLNTKTMKTALLSDINAGRMAELQLGTCEGWKFKSERGYDITGHVFLPADYDATKKYPMIVHYYGGCAPTSRRFGGGSHYPAHYWNALGYVVLIVNPSGADGFGQEWAARHVNTAGEGPAQDIIEATKWYADNHAFVDSEKIGCVSASYGGFMTQYIMTKTDMFACGISHAGISDHTSYWGEGYWGYNYSEVSMANSYPWTRKDLFVDRSPLYNADKIHKPLLFTHGTADTNVPIGESIQMFTALKLLGVPTAFVMVEGENHHVMDYNKRVKWINTMTAWFDKYLKGDSTWWDMIYTPKEL